MDSPMALVVYLVVLALVVALAWRVVHAIVRRLSGATAAARLEKAGRHDPPGLPKG